uniref:Uncharacterized protein n=1 Tax=Ascaris lumbricoides TaxID=6252 RepID=A0A0M3HFZ9_ASCLU
MRAPLLFILALLCAIAIVRCDEEVKEEKAVEEKVEQQEQTGNIGCIYLIDQANNIGE